MSFLETLSISPIQVEREGYKLKIPGRAEPLSIHDMASSYETTFTLATLALGPLTRQAFSLSGRHLTF